MNYPVVCQSMLVIVLTIPTFGAANEFSYNLSKQASNRSVFNYIGTNRKSLGEPTNHGIIITVPDDQSGKSQVGLETKFKVSGDFELTLNYDLLDTSPPEKGYGAGVMLRLLQVDGLRINFSRSLKSDGTHKFSTAVWRNQKGQWVPDVERFPARHSNGQMRIVRQGGTLRFLAADGDSEEFKELRKIYFGADPLKSVAIYGDSGGDSNPIKVLLKTFSMKADNIFYGVAPAKRKLIWSAWGITSILGIGILVGLVIVVISRRRSL